MARTDLKGHAELRLWDLDDNSTRYDYLLAAPSDEQLTKYWTAWAVVSLAGGLFVACVLVAILSSRSALKRPFNLYLVYLMIPDALYSTLCGIVCMLNALNGAQTGIGVCNFQMVFIVWGVGSNMWLNAAVSHQLHRMLQDSQGFVRYKPPTRRYVTTQALLVYCFCLFLGTWGLVEAQRFPHYVASTSGLVCLPVEQDGRSSVFFWLVFFPLFVGIPVAYVHYVCFDTWRRNLLPPRGKRRLLAVYFGRIVVVFVLMWVPSMILVFVMATWMPYWVHFAGGALSHLQGAVSAALCLLKPDIALAVRNFYTCRCNQRLLSSSLRRSWEQHVANRPQGSSLRHSWRRFFFQASDSPFSRTETPFGSQIADQFASRVEPVSEEFWPEENGSYIEEEGEEGGCGEDPIAVILEDMGEEDDATRHVEEGGSPKENFVVDPKSIAEEETSEDTIDQIVGEDGNPKELVEDPMAQKGEEGELP